MMGSFKWIPDKLRLLRALLLGVSGAIAYEILNGYVSYHNQVLEYMQSVAYQEAQAAREEYRQKLKRNQLQPSTDDSLSNISKED